MTSDTDEFWDEDSSDDDDLGSTRVAESPFHRLQREAAASTRDRAYLMMLTGPDTGKIHKLAEGQHVIGRSNRADLQLDDDSISRLHAKVRYTGTEIFIEDLGSVNGTYVNGQRCNMQPLKDGDKIRLGDTTILKFGIHDALDEQFQQRLYQAALRDDLTGAYNKKYFMEHLAKEFRFALRHRSQLSLVMIDIDHFKRLNDTYGHVAGDAVLSQLGNALGQGLRTEDLFARYGGEEFCIVARGISLDQAAMLAERMRLIVEATLFPAGGHSLRITASFGVGAVLHDQMTDHVDLIKTADEAMYRAKHAGRNRVAMAPSPT